MSTEKGTEWILSLFEPARHHRLFILRLAHVEFASALARRVREGTLSSSNQSAALRLFAYHLSQQLSVVEVDAALCGHAAALTSTRALRAYDSLQLAGALRVSTVLLAAGSEGLVVLSADARLLKAAQEEGLAVENPESH